MLPVLSDMARERVGCLSQPLRQTPPIALYSAILPPISEAIGIRDPSTVGTPHGRSFIGADRRRCMIYPRAGFGFSGADPPQLQTSIVDTAPISSSTAADQKAAE